jgi:hypothetical protein
LCGKAVGLSAITPRHKANAQGFSCGVAAATCLPAGRSLTLSRNSNLSFISKGRDYYKAKLNKETNFLNNNKFIK